MALSNDYTRYRMAEGIKHLHHAKSCILIPWQILQSRHLMAAIRTLAFFMARQPTYWVHTMGARGKERSDFENLPLKKSRLCREVTLLIT
jgi:hypothetical protein